MKTSQNSQKKTASRRGFLGITAGVLGVGVAAVATKSKSLAASEILTDEHGNREETQHVRTYYELARF